MNATETPLAVIANVSRVVTKVIDRVSGDRVEVPLMVAAATVHALKNHGIAGRIYYGPVAWIEILEDQTPIWAGCWGENFGFWVGLENGEVIDLNTAQAHRKPVSPGQATGMKTVGSTPLIWSAELPSFYRCKIEGVAELELTDEGDRKKFDTVLREIDEKCRPELLRGDAEAFPNEPIVCPGRKILDDSKGSFKHFDRALAVLGVPPPPAGISS